VQRLQVAPRADWRQKFEALGFSFHSADGGYWDETACYRFSSAEIDELEAATAELHRMALAAVKHVIDERRGEALGIAAPQAALIERAWRSNAPSLYGRFDLAYDGRQPPKLLEYNADTPTSVLEAAVAQWHWLEETGRPDQFNSLHERLIARWAAIFNTLPPGTRVHFSCLRDHEEDRVCVEYLRDTAVQAGLATAFVHIEDLGWDGAQFVDLDGEPVSAWFKLYPWEWLVREEFAAHLGKNDLHIIEPAWKALLSNKGMLAILWELFPDHPNLLPAYFAPDYLGARFVAKPFFSREGANISIVDRERPLVTPGPYAAEPKVYQALADLPAFDGRYPVIGAWIVGDEPAGMGIREDVTPVTTNTSRFIPHFFE
jgi:glutathionylspermidine synthase